MTSLPPARYFDAIPYRIDGEETVILRDPLYFLPNPVTVSVPGFFLLALLDGERSLEDVREECRERYGFDVPPTDLEQLVRQFDEHGLLYSERFQRLRTRVLEEFRTTPVRRAAHAGTAYESTSEALTRQIDDFYAEARKSPSPEDDAFSQEEFELCGVVLPHIDPRVGGVCAAQALDTLRDLSPAPDVFVIFGTAHGPGNSPFILTEKSFSTPFGEVEVDTELARAIAAEFPVVDWKADEYLHKHEHSVEFPVVYLQHLYGNNHRFRILPVLTGSFHEFIASNTIPSSDPVVGHFAETVRKASEKLGRRVFYVAGADLCHRGRKFGDEQGVSEEFLEETRRNDAEMLGHVAEGRREDFFRHLQCTGDEQKVCGLPPIYMTMLTIGEECRGRLTSYDINVEDETDSFVSFAGMALYAPRSRNLA
jgi:AmmeMemoRadiSam system protein B